MSMENETLYIVTKEYDMLLEQQSILNNIHGYPKDNDEHYCDIIKHSCDDKWLMPFFVSDADDILVPLRMFIFTEINEEEFI